MEKEPEPSGVCREKIIFIFTEIKQEFSGKTKLGTFSGREKNWIFILILVEKETGKISCN